MGCNLAYIYSPWWFANQLPFRFIPERTGQDLQANFSLLPDEASPITPSRAKRHPANGELHFQRSRIIQIYLDAL
jgi:hypothetical protein